MRLDDRKAWREGTLERVEYENINPFWKGKEEHPDQSAI